MEHVRIDAVEPSGEMAGQERRSLTDALGTTNVSIDRFVVEPGGEFTGGIHATTGREEVVYVTRGTATYESTVDPSADPETVTVEAGELVRFAPGEYKQGRNETDEPVEALTIGAPPDAREYRVPQPCGTCGESVYLVAEPGDAGIELVCPECGAGVSP